MTRGRFIRRLFWTFVVGWVVLLLVGLVWRLPYVGRGFAGITLPLYGGCMLLALSLAGVRGGSIWRGRHPPVERATAPLVYWGMVTLMLGAGTALVGDGLYNLIHRPRPRLWSSRPPTRSVRGAPLRHLSIGPLGPEPAENLGLSEEDRLLEVGCRWQALDWRGHLELLSARGDGGRPSIRPLYRELRRPPARPDTGERRHLASGIVYAYIDR